MPDGDDKIMILKKWYSLKPQGSTVYLLKVLIDLYLHMASQDRSSTVKVCFALSRYLYFTYWNAGASLGISIYGFNTVSILEQVPLKRSQKFAGSVEPVLTKPLKMAIIFNRRAKALFVILMNRHLVCIKYKLKFLKIIWQ